MPLGYTLICAIEVADDAIAHQAEDTLQSIVRTKAFPLLEIMQRAALAYRKIKDQSCWRSEYLNFFGVDFFFLSSPHAARRHRWDVVLPARHHRR